MDAKKNKISDAVRAKIISADKAWIKENFTDSELRYLQRKLHRILNGEIRESGILKCPFCQSDIIAKNQKETKARCIHCGYVWTL